jgi:hypothetical protein
MMHDDTNEGRAVKARALAYWLDLSETRKGAAIGLVGVVWLTAGAVATLTVPALFCRFLVAISGH